MNSGPPGFNGPGGPVPSYGYPHPVSQGLPGGPNNVYMMEANNHMPRNYANEYLAAASDGSEYPGPNWPQRVMDELKDMQLVLSVDGRIKYASPSCQLITGHAVEQLVGNFLESFMHEDDKSIYKREINEAITSRHPLRFHFRFSKANNTFSILEAYGHAHMVTRNGAAAPNNLGNRCDGFFLLCRPYPTKSAQLLDSFLEHKVENIRLSQRIAELKREEEEDLKGSRPHYYKSEHTDSQAASSEGRSPVASLNSAQSNAPSASTTTADKAGLSESAYENTYQDDSGNNTATENQPERNTRLESLSHIDGIEVLTGLYYGDGERSQGLSTGEKRARLIQCDIDITTAADQRMRSAQDGDKRKRLKGEYVCSDCGTYDSPEWRKGPNGPKTLCNACGLRWAKKEKKRQGSG